MRFFEKYHRTMLVINGVDAQTNAHSVGIVHNWSGRNSEGYPTLGALCAAHYAPAHPVPYLSFGGFSNTAGLTRFTRLDDPRLLHEIASPIDDMGSFFSDEDWEAMAQASFAELEHDLKMRRTRRELFLEKMDNLVL